MDFESAVRRIRCEEKKIRVSECMFEVAASSEDKSFKTSRLDNHRHSSIVLVNLPPLMAMPLGEWAYTQ